MRVLCLDVGEERIGVAVSDEKGLLARPLEVIHRRSKQEDFQAISGLIEKWHVARLVIGLPLTLEGEIGPQARRVRRYGRTLSKTLAIPIDFEDERYSTVDALGVMRVTGGPRKKQRDRVDAVAATIILQSYLDTANRRHSDENQS